MNDEYQDDKQRLRDLLDRFELSPPAEFATKNLDLSVQFSLNKIASEILESYKHGSDDTKEYTQKCLYDLLLSHEGLAESLRSAQLLTAYLVANTLKTFGDLFASHTEVVMELLPEGKNPDHDEVFDTLSKRMLEMNLLAKDSMETLAAAVEFYAANNDEEAATGALTALRFLGNYQKDVISDVELYCRMRGFEKNLHDSL